MSKAPRSLASAALLAVALSAALPAQSPPYVQFESPQTNPLRLSADGRTLFAVDTAASTLSVFDLADPALPLLVQQIHVGLEPVSVMPRSSDEVWVVNHVSDSVSIVSLALGTVVATLAVQDEPCDVVFAGSPQQAFVSAARSNAVKVFDPTTRRLVATIALAGEHPRALATSADGSRVFVAFALSGNRTTGLPRGAAPSQGPPTNPALPPAPQTSRIVDATDPAWAPAVVRWTVLDHDVAELDAQSLAVRRYFDRVGTVNLGLAVQPGTGDLFVANTDARNLVRFEPNLRGHVVDNRVTRITTGATPGVSPFDLNPGLDYGTLPNPAALATALAQPTGLAFEPSGASLWVAAFGTDRVAKLAPDGTVLARVEVGQAAGAQVAPRTKRGPRGLAMHPTQPRLYVQNRISNTLSVIDTATARVLRELPVGTLDPTPTEVREGRGFLYDAKLSGNGTVSCASCHVDGEEDHLAWDLGDPTGAMQRISDPSSTRTFDVHPMKGPMTTQTMKGLDGVGPFHWRGDRADLGAFNAAFDSLMGGTPISAADLASFDAFVRSMHLQPNPYLQLDRSVPATVLGGDPVLGRAQFQQSPSPGGGPNACSSCHSLPEQFVARIRIQSPGDQAMKVPFMRSYYKKHAFSNRLGAQNLLGFGLEHDGTIVAANAPGGTVGPITAFFLAFDTGTAPAVGAQRTLHGGNASDPTLAGELATLQTRAALGDADLIGHGTILGVRRGLLFDPALAAFRVDASGVGPFTATELRNLAAAGQATISLLGVPPGLGRRFGLDRDADGVLDGDATRPGFSAAGSGCAGSGAQVPVLVGLGSATAGAAFAFDLSGGLGAAPAILGVGLGEGTAPISPHCSLRILPLLPEALIFPVLGGSGPGNGTTRLGGLLPASLQPMDLWFQALVLDQGAPDGFALSNALRAAFE